jgi:hypothetical protein
MVCVLGAVLAIRRRETHLLVDRLARTNCDTLMLDEDVVCRIDDEHAVNASSERLGGLKRSSQHLNKEVCDAEDEEILASDQQ